MRSVVACAHISHTLRHATSPRNAASVKLSSAEAAYAAAEVSDHSTAVAALQSELHRQLQERSSLQMLLRLGGAGGTNSTVEDYSTADLMPSGSSVGPWTQLVLHMQHNDAANTQKSSVFASQTSWGLDLGIASGSGSSSESGASSDSTYTMHNTDMSVGFEAMKVTIDRSSWFDPTFFKFTPVSCPAHCAVVACVMARMARLTYVSCRVVCQSYYKILGTDPEDATVSQKIASGPPTATCESVCVCVLAGVWVCGSLTCGPMVQRSSRQRRSRTTSCPCSRPRSSWCET